MDNVKCLVGRVASSLRVVDEAPCDSVCKNTVSGRRHRAPSHFQSWLTVNLSYNKVGDWRWS